MNTLVWGSILMAAATLMSLYGSSLIADETRRRRGWLIVSLGIAGMIGREALIYLHAEESGKTQAAAIQDVKAVVEGVDRIGRNHEASLKESLQEVAKTAKSQERLQETMSANLAISAANAEANDRTVGTILHTANMQLLLQQYLAENDAIAQRTRGIQTKVDASLRSHQITLRAIVAGIGNEVPGNGIPVLHRKELYELARRMKRDLITKIQFDEARRFWSTRLQAAASQTPALQKEVEEALAGFDQFAESIKKLQEPLDKAIEVLETDRLTALAVKIQAHDLEQWLHNYEIIWAHLAQEMLQRNGDARARTLAGFQKDLAAVIKLRDGAKLSAAPIAPK